MVKILSQAGNSLADMYDVEGSIAGISDLHTRELGIVHEMGATIFSERFRTTYRRLESAPTVQTGNINLAIVNMPEGISRILGVQVLADDATRIANCQVSVQEPLIGQDFPIWVFDVGNVGVVRIEDQGVGVTRDLLIPQPGQTLPCFITNGQAHLEMSEITVGATATAFGAGTVILYVLIHFGFTYQGGVSAIGARVPSW